jgi:hypothetical protein
MSSIVRGQGCIPVVVLLVHETLKRTETTVHNQFKIAQLALSEDDGGKSGGLGLELVVAGSIASDEVLEDTTVRSVGHNE